VEADDIENLPADLIEQREGEGAPVRLDVQRAGYVKVSDYPDLPVPPASVRVCDRCDSSE